MSTIEIHAQDCPKSWSGYKAMVCECEPVAAPESTTAREHVAPADAWAEVLKSWAQTAHIALESETYGFRTRVESPVL